MPDPIKDGDLTAPKTLEHQEDGGFQAELKARRQILTKWMRNVSFDLHDPNNIQKLAYSELKHRLALLTVRTEPTKQENPSVWEMIEQCIPEDERKTFPEPAVRELQAPLAGEPLTILSKTMLVQHGSPVAASFDRLEQSIRKNAALNRIHVSLYPLESLS